MLCLDACLLMFRKSSQYGLEVSKHLKAILSDETGLSWLTEGREYIALLSATLSLLHPGLFEAGMQCAAAMWQHEIEASVRKAMNVWPSIFHAIEVISNCDVARRRDPSTRVQWFDMLSSVGGQPDASLLVEGHRRGGRRYRRGRLSDGPGLRPLSPLLGPHTAAGSELSAFYAERTACADRRRRAVPRLPWR